MIIEVKRKHIKKGVRGDACDCPVALALKDVGVSFDSDGGRRYTGIDEFEINTVDLSYRSPRSVARFVKKFDKTGKGKPFRFRLIEAK